MNKIEFPRIGVDGIVWTKKNIEDWYENSVKDDIDNRLKSIPTSSDAESALVEYVRHNLKRFLFASPTELLQITNDVNVNYKGVIEKKDDQDVSFGKRILNAFNYKGYRSTVLVELAKRINVKTCCYCNMHYTLYAQEGKDELAKLQFDHFFDKGTYPMLSMSLYNLIPSCAVCNQGKSQGQLSLDFHPYVSSIHENFHFEQSDLLPYLWGGENKADRINIELVPEHRVNKDELNKYDEIFHLKALYERHGDVAQEVFDKAYAYSYYQNMQNFGFLFGKESSYRTRLWLGTYVDEKDIEKRPLTKFIQDLWKQAFSERKI